MSARRILIAGCGYVGTKLAEILRDGGDQVIGLRRDVSKLPSGIAAFSADLSDRATLAGLPDGLDAVVYSAAASDSSDAAYREAYVDGLRNLLARLTEQKQSPRRFVFTSSTGVYPQDDGSIVDEETATGSDDLEGRVDRVREGERLLVRFPIRSIVVRFGGIYGPGRTRFVESVRNGTIRYRERPPQWTNRIHRDDCAGVLRHLLDLEDPAPLYLGVDDEPAPLHEVVRYVAGLLGCTPPPPTGIAGEGKRCSNARLRASGYRFSFPTYREGYAALVTENT